MKQTIRMLKLEEELYVDKNGTRQQELLDALGRIQSRLQRELRQLHDPGTHKELQAALQAVTSAQRVLLTLRVR